MPKRTKTESKALPNFPFMAKVRLIYGQDTDQQPVMRRILMAEDEKEALSMAQTYFIIESAGDQDPVEFAKEMNSDENLGDIYNEVRDAWRDIKITPLEDWLAQLESEWTEI